LQIQETNYKKEAVEGVKLKNNLSKSANSKVQILEMKLEILKPEFFE